MASAELAVAIPALVVVLAGCLSGLQVAVQQIQCVDAARVGARMMARGDDPSRVGSSVVSAAPRGAAVGLDVSAESVTVTVTAPPGPWARLGLVPAARGQATAGLERAAAGG